MSEPRYPLHLTMGQLSDLKTLLDAATASEADPDAEIFALLDQVREARKQAAGLSDRNQARATEVLSRSPAASEWPRADPVALEQFDPATKTCNMNCGPHAHDPRSRKERLFLCDDC